jgi:hypothetical protein
MSAKATGYIFDLKLPPSVKLIALAYADHADHDGRNIYPSLSTIARKTGMSRRSVIRITQWLHENKLMIQDGVGPKRTNRWRIDMDWNPSEIVTPWHHGANHDQSLGDTMTPESLTITTTTDSESIESVVVSNLGDTVSPVIQSHQDNLNAMEEFGIQINKKTLDIAGRPYVTPSYIRALGLELKQRKNGDYQPGLLVTILDSGAEAPKLNKRGHLMDCKCDECRGCVGNR